MTSFAAVTSASIPHPPCIRKYNIQTGSNQYGLDWEPKTPWPQATPCLRAPQPLSGPGPIPAPSCCRRQRPMTPGLMTEAPGLIKLEKRRSGITMLFTIDPLPPGPNARAHAPGRSGSMIQG
jgi:hypothetical protein